MAVAEVRKVAADLEASFRQDDATIATLKGFLERRLQTERESAAAHRSAFARIVGDGADEVSCGVAFYEQFMQDLAAIIRQVDQVGGSLKAHHADIRGRFSRIVQRVDRIERNMRVLGITNDISLISLVSQVGRWTLSKVFGTKTAVDMAPHGARFRQELSDVCDVQVPDVMRAAAEQNRIACAAARDVMARVVRAEAACHARCAGALEQVAVGVERRPLALDRRLAVVVRVARLLGACGDFAAGAQFDVVRDLADGWCEGFVGDVFATVPGTWLEGPEEGESEEIGLVLEVDGEYDGEVRFDVGDEAYVRERRGEFCWGWNVARPDESGKFPVRIIRELRGR